MGSCWLVGQSFEEGKVQLPVSPGAGGNDLAQLKIPFNGVVTTSQKYTLTHSRHNCMLSRGDLGQISVWTSVRL